MKRYQRKPHYLIAITLFASLIANIVHSETTANGENPCKAKSIAYENNPNQWSFAFDNDILMPQGRDQDYTYGASFGFAGKEVSKHWLSLHKPLEYLDRTFISTGPGITRNIQQIEYGLLGFTPEDITTSEVQDGDRPYASLIYVSSSRETFDLERNISWNSSITVGMLGLEIVGQLQEYVHEATEGDKPEGWSQQIASNGEPTAKFSIARSKLLFESDHLELKSTNQASLGYITELGWGLSARAGEVNSPWASFNPELVSYGQGSAKNAQSKLLEHYIWAGFSLKTRAYNAFLQGQFRDSEFDYESDDLRHIIAEGWLGYTLALTNGYRFTYTLRGHSAELNSGIGNRSVVWGGLKLSKTFI